jgi:hypothetical protein
VRFREPPSRKFVRKKPGQPFDRELRRAIDAPAREGGIADDRRDVDDVTLARAAQMGQDGAGDLEQAEDVGLELALDLLRGRLLDRGQQAVAGVVHEDVDAAEAVDRCLGGGDGLCLVVDVERRGKQVALSAEGGRDGIGISRRGDHEVTALERVACDLEAEATRRTGDEPNLLAVPRHVGVLSVARGA